MRTTSKIIVGKQLFLLIAVVFYLGTSLKIVAANYYVSISGNDGNNGSQASPFRTIQKAANVVAAGDVVHVASGTYVENINLTKNGTSSARIRFISDTEWGAKISPSGGDYVWKNSGNYVDINGFDISASSAPALRLGIYNTGSHVRIYRNHIYDIQAQGSGGNGGAGIITDGTAAGNYTGTNVDIYENVIHDIAYGSGSNNVQGIYFSHKVGTIKNNLIYRISAYNIHLWHNASDIVISSNTVFSGGAGGIMVGAGDSPGTGFANNCTVSNNIVIGMPRGIREYGDVGSNNRYINNLLWNNSTNFSLIAGSQSGTITADPQFVNYQANGSGDYHLTSGSPAIDAGTATGAPAVDHDGNTRPQNAGYDIGAYEYSASCTGVQQAYASIPSLPLHIEAEEYDKGVNCGNYSAYYDAISGNSGNSTFRNDDVDLRDDGNGTIVVANNHVGEWREYSANLPNGTYNFIARVSTINANAQMIIKLGMGPDGTSFVTADTINIPNTGGWLTYQTVSQSITITNGGNGKVIRLETINSSFDIDWFEINVPITTSINENESSFTNIYPNPFNTNFTLEISSEIIIKDAILKIYDVCGKEVKAISINSNETTIEKGELQSGVYFYSIVNDTENIDKGKLIVY